MSHTNLADTRLLTLDDAKATLEALAHAECRCQSVAAAGEKRIAKIKSDCQTATAADQALISVLEARLTAFILGNRALFKDKRTVKTDFGSFGLRAANNRLAVTNEEQAIAHAKAKGLTDLVETVERLVLDAVKTRIKAGETIPGCSLPTGEQAFYTIAKAILEAADKGE
jgi:phage host-nuclease inhibitor protein Gam